MSVWSSYDVLKYIKNGLKTTKPKTWSYRKVKNKVALAQICCYYVWSCIGQLMSFKKSLWSYKERFY